jgi:hypothetical protein
MGGYQRLQFAPAPHMRRCSARLVPGVPARRVRFAHAEVPRSTTWNCDCGACPLRSRGGAPSGKRRLVEVQVLPAYAGVFRSATARRTAGGCSPRTRGGAPGPRCGHYARTPSAPLARRCSGRRDWLPELQGVCLVHAGVLPGVTL